MNSDHSCTICTLGAPVLRKKAKRMEVFDGCLKETAKKMVQDLYISNGIGLAAPQVGLSMQLIVIDLQDLAQDNIVLDGRSIPLNLIFPLCITNPSYDPVNDVQEVGTEGCLSVPGLMGSVKRYYEILLTYQDLDGAAHQLQCKDLMARCVQHECDHLQGVLFIDRLSKQERSENKAVLDEIKSLGGHFTYHKDEEEQA